MVTRDLFPHRRPSLTTVEIHRRFSKVYDHLYANAAVKTPSAIAHEVGKLLHVALYLEEVKDVRPAFVFSQSQLRDVSSNRTDLPGKVASIVRECFGEMNDKWGLYPEEDIIALTDSDIAFSVGQLSGVSFSDPGRDIFGDAVEIFRSQWVKQQGGQYFTDQRVTRLAMELLEFDPWGGDDLVDICAGTGGFLQAAFHHIRMTVPQRATKSNRDASIVKVAQATLRGAEIDREVADLANAALDARLGQKACKIVSYANSLLAQTFDAPEFPINYSTHKCAASNPPFGTKITVKDPTILAHYALARLYQRKPDGTLEATGRLTSRAPDVLFLEQNIRILKPGDGRLALVTPYQILSGPQTLYIREWLLKQAKILAVVDLPSETFQPHTGTKTCLLVVQRREEPLQKVDLSSDPQVFMSIPKWIGHDRRGNPVYKRQEDGTETSDILSDFGEVGQAFRSFRTGQMDCSKYHQDSFIVNPNQISDDPEFHLNARFHKPSKLKSLLMPTVQEKSVSHEWTVVKMSDAVDRIFFPSRFKRNYVVAGEGTVPFLGGSNISQMLINNHKWLRSDDPKLPELRVYAGWVLVTRSGSTGIVSIVPPAWDGFAMSEHIIRIVPKHNGIPSEYIFAFLRTKFAQEILDRGIFGSVIDEITPDFIGMIEMPIPKSKSNLSTIVHKIQKGEAAKQAAIDSLLSGVEELESYLGTLGS